MKALVSEKEAALALRKKGYSYKEILQEVQVAKSTLSLWLRDTALTKDEKHLLKDRTDENISRGRIKAATALHSLRLARDQITFEEAKVLFQKHKDDPFFQLGIGLYWAEGAKRSSAFAFMNSDSAMIQLMVKWIIMFLEIEVGKIRMRLYSHRAFSGDGFEDYWSKESGISIENFGKTIYKPSALTKRRPLYKGCLRIELGPVKYIRIMAFWQQMLIEHYRKQR